MGYTSMTVMTALGAGRNSYLPATAQSISHAACYSPLPVQWIISYSTFDYTSEDLRYLEDTPNVEVLLLPIEGPVNAATGRNHAIMHAGEKSIMVNCDSDDLFTEERFSMIDISQENTIWLCCAHDVINGEVKTFSSPKGGLWEFPWWEDKVEGDDDIPHFGFLLSTLVIPRSIAVKSGGYPALDYMEDSVFMKKVHDICSPRLIAYPEVGYLYRKHPDQSSSRDYDTSKIWTTWMS